MYRSTQYGLYIIGKYINLASFSIFGAIFLGKHGKFLWRRTFLKIRLLLDVAFDASFGNLKWVMTTSRKHVIYVLFNFNDFSLCDVVKCLLQQIH